MADRIGIAVHHQENIFAARNDEMGGIVTRLRGLGEKIRVAIFELKILDPPGTPEGFDFGFGKLHGLVRQRWLRERIG